NVVEVENCDVDIVTAPNDGFRAFCLEQACWAPAGQGSGGRPSGLKLAKLLSSSGG
ncbi:hypothetical protein Dimus_036667, partial [Dionaea muscipula]